MANPGRSSLDPSIFASLALLFGVAAQFRAMDGYTFLRRAISALEPRLGVLYAVVLIAAVISPFVLNDVVILILTPVLVRYAKQFEVDVAPLVVAEITFTNIASSVSPLGNPQNILLWQASGISIGGFIFGTALPLALSGVVAVAMLYPFKRRLGGAREFPADIGSWSPAVYLVAVTAIVFSLDVVGVPSVMGLLISFLFGFGFTRSVGTVAKEFDLKSLLILWGLVGSVAVVSFLLQPVLVQLVAPAATGEQPYSALFVGGVSNVISNVPATQLLLGVTGVSAGAAPRIAVEAGLAGNIGPVGSFANILALLMVRRSGMGIRRAVLLQLAVGVVAYVPAFL